MACAVKGGLNSSTGSSVPAKNEVDSLIKRYGEIVKERIKVPEGFKKVGVPEDSFGEYLRNLPLKP